MKVGCQKPSKDSANITPMTGPHHTYAHMLDHFRKLRSVRKWDKAMDINPENEMSSTTQYQKAFLMYVENEYFAKYGQMPVIILVNVQHTHFFPSAIDSLFGQ
jgi:hypothetical protein